MQVADWPGVQADILDAFIEQMAVNAKQRNNAFWHYRFMVWLYQAVAQTLKQSLKLADVPAIEALTAGLQLLKQCDLRSALMSLRCPVTVILGTEDRLIPLASGQAIQQIMPGIKVHIIADAGHVLFLSHSEHLLAILRAAL